ncbi:hypothetical protein [uncultured Winogradskyella sp.]|uniref:hypothetical protein n=1 Tax=uncultured Winogradskyella sp. TaxID=395353 RepID=UPI00262D3F6D|nr:hypothetical protein [uncultured Winogradskyella sp.]|tara:strand:- start:4780 stop:5304 length:525 start_codon:yes stop_codon:yes gene_type:complete
MDKKKQIRLILVAIFWIVIYFITKIQKFESVKNPYFMATIYAVFIGHIFYEGIYKKKKIEHKKNEIKANHLAELKNKKSDLTPKINNEDLPTELIEFIPIFKKWGIDNKILKKDLYENAKHSELFELKSIENKRDIIEKWIKNSSYDNPNISKALNLTLESYDELGLWTWETKN